MNTTIIQLFGGPSVGKSTIAAELFVLMKKSSRFGSVELVQEYAKELVWQERFDELKTQKNVTNGQIQKIIPLVGKVDYLITDSPLLLGVVYSPENEFTEIQNLVFSHIDKFSRTINIFIERGDSDYETAGRIHTEDEAKKVDQLIKFALDGYRIPYHTIGRDGVAEILNII